MNQSCCAAKHCIEDRKAISDDHARQRKETERKAMKSAWMRELSHEVREKVQLVGSKSMFGPTLAIRITRTYDVPMHPDCMLDDLQFKEFTQVAAMVCQERLNTFADSTYWNPITEQREIKTAAEFGDM